MSVTNEALVGPQPILKVAGGWAWRPGPDRNPLKTWEIVASIVWNLSEADKTDQKLIKNWESCTPDGEGPK